MTVHHLWINMLKLLDISISHFERLKVQSLQVEGIGCVDSWGWVKEPTRTKQGGVLLINAINCSSTMSGMVCVGFIAHDF